ncbi:MAG: SIR2 family protein [Thermoguttaceae bacterium]
MASIEIDKALREIRIACDAHIKDGFHPFVFIVGAGVSHPPIPLSSEIQEHCRTKAMADGEPDLAPTGDAMKDYSHWFDCAYPHAAERQYYLQDLLRDQPISAANLRLAHILESGRVADIVVTPNFDDLLARGLALFGKECVVCDHPNTAQRIDPERHNVVQIVHVHGSYWFYDCCNLSDEISDRSTGSAHSTMTMGSLLDRVFAKRSPLVVGYAGWEEDVIMASLRRRLQGQRLAYRLYWFCYRDTDLDHLPAWLREHRDVRFVLPAPSSRPAADVSTVLPGAAVTGDGKSHGSSAPEPLLSARSVLDAIVSDFKLDAPKLTRDPLTFYEEHLKRSVLYDKSNPNEDLYSIQGVIHRISQGRKLEAQARQARDIALEKVRDALRRSEYTEVIKNAAAIDPASLEIPQVNELIAAMEEAIRSDKLKADDSAEGHAPACKLLAQLAEAHRSSLETRTDKLIFWAGGSRANHLYQKRNNVADAVALLDELISQYGAQDSSELEALLARCFNSKGCALEKGGQLEQALKTFEETSHRFPNCGETTVYATNNAAIMLNKMGRLEEAIDQNERAIECIKRFPKEEMVKAAEIVENFRKTLNTSLAAKKAAAEKAAAEKAAAEKAAAEKADAESGVSGAD